MSFNQVLKRLNQFKLECALLDATNTALDSFELENRFVPEGICPMCYAELGDQKSTIDFYDPGQSDGHGQMEVEYYGCRICGYSID